MGDLTKRHLVLASIFVALLAGPSMAPAETLTVQPNKLAPSTFGRTPLIASSPVYGTFTIATWITGGSPGIVQVAAKSGLAGNWRGPIAIARGAYSALPVAGYGDLAILASGSDGVHLFGWSERTGRWIHRHLTGSINDVPLSGRLDAYGRLTLLIARRGGTSTVFRPRLTVMSGNVRSAKGPWTATARPIRPYVDTQDLSIGFDTSRTGVAAVTWRTPGGLIKVTRAIGTGPWETPVTIATGPQARSDVAVSHTGIAVVAWATPDGDSWINAGYLKRGQGAASWPTTPDALPDGIGPFPAINDHRFVAFAGSGTGEDGVGEVRVARRTSAGWGVARIPIGGCTCAPTIGQVIMDHFETVFITGTRRGIAGDVASSQGFVAKERRSSYAYPPVPPAIYPVLGSALFGQQAAINDAGVTVIWGRIHGRNHPIRTWSLE